MTKDEINLIIKANKLHMASVVKLLKDNNYTFPAIDKHLNLRIYYNDKGEHHQKGRSAENLIKYYWQHYQHKVM